MQGHLCGQSLANGMFAINPTNTMLSFCYNLVCTSRRCGSQSRAPFPSLSAAGITSWLCLLRRSFRRVPRLALGQALPGSTRSFWFGFRQVILEKSRPITPAAALII